MLGEVEGKERGSPLPSSTHYSINFDLILCLSELGEVSYRMEFGNKGEVAHCKNMLPRAEWGQGTGH